VVDSSATQPEELGTGVQTRRPDRYGFFDVGGRREARTRFRRGGERLRPPEPLRNGTPVFPLISSSGVGYFTIRAKQARAIRLSFDASPPSGHRRIIRLADDSHELPVAVNAPKTHISVVVAIPRGVSLLLVKTDPAPQSRADAIVISKLEVDRTTEPAQLRALLQDGEPGF
jgi:hypothetical protein